MLNKFHMHGHWYLGFRDKSKRHALRAYHHFSDVVLSMNVCVSQLTDLVTFTSNLLFGRQPAD